jgi:hypothetical protein
MAMTIVMVMRQIVNSTVKIDEIGSKKDAINRFNVGCIGVFTSVNKLVLSKGRKIDE